jgi:hypothetical protein
VILEVGHHRAPVLDFDCVAPPQPKMRYALMHYLKVAFNQACHHIVLSGWG